MAEGLTAYVREAKRRPFEWGVHDCCTYPAGWVLLRTGMDPMARWRGRYWDEAGALRLLDGEGGMVEAFRAALAAVEDVHVAVVEVGGVTAGAIRSGRLLSVLTQRGVGCIRDDLCRVVWSS